MEIARLQKFIREVPDFPKKGILFYDITPLLKDPDAFAGVIDHLVKKFKNESVDTIVGIESRGFIFGAALAKALKVGFVPVRKKGKLPYKTRQVTYDLEYGKDVLEMHEDALKKGERVLIIDDLLATGGTAKAVADLAETVQAEVVGLAFVVELAFLKGREKLNGRSVYSIIQY